MTKTEFKRNAERIFLRGNPTATITGWIIEPRRIKYPTGIRGLQGKFHAVADGYQPRVLHADWDDQTGLMVR